MPAESREKQPVPNIDPPKFPSLGMSDETAKKVLDIFDLNHPFLQGFLRRSLAIILIFVFGILLGKFFWAGSSDPNQINLSPLDYIPAFFMSYAMWMGIDMFFMALDDFRSKKKPSSL